MQRFLYMSLQKVAKRFYCKQNSNWNFLLSYFIVLCIENVEVNEDFHTFLGLVWKFKIPVLLDQRRQNTYEQNMADHMGLGFTAH